MCQSTMGQGCAFLGRSGPWEFRAIAPRHIAPRHGDLVRGMGRLVQGMFGPRHGPFWSEARSGNGPQDRLGVTVRYTDYLTRNPTRDEEGFSSLISVWQNGGFGFSRSPRTFPPTQHHEEGLLLLINPFCHRKIRGAVIKPGSESEW